MVQMYFIRRNGSEWDYSMPDVNITSIWTLSSTGCSCSFSDRCPFSLMPYYSTAWGSSVFMFKCDFPSSFGEVLLTQQKLCDIRWWERAIKKMLHMFWIRRCLLVRMGASWYWFCRVCGEVYLPCVSICHTLWHWDLSWRRQDNERQ